MNKETVLETYTNLTVSHWPYKHSGYVGQIIYKCTVLYKVLTQMVLLSIHQAVQIYLYFKMRWLVKFVTSNTAEKKRSRPFL